MAAVLVAFRHIPGPLPDSFSQPLTYLAVDIFFLLSGVVIANAYENKLRDDAMLAPEFMVRRLFRIYPLYQIGSIVGALAIVLNGSASPAMLALFSVLSIAFVPNPITGFEAYPLDMPAWSLFFELFANLIYAKLLLRRPVHQLLLIMLFCLLVLGIEGVVSGMGLNIGWQKKLFLMGVPRVLFSFLTGVLLYRVTKRRNYSMPSVKSNLAAILVVGAICGILCAPIEETRHQIVAGLLAVCIMFPLLIFYSLRLQITGLTSKAFNFLGELSFPLYAFHMPMYALLIIVFGRIKPLPILFKGDMFCVIVVISYLAYRFIDVPLRAVLNAKIRKFFRSRKATVSEVRGVGIVAPTAAISTKDVRWRS